MAGGIPAGSNQESRFLPGSCQELKSLAGKGNFPAGILTGSWQEKILAGVLARIPAKLFQFQAWSCQDFGDPARTTVIRQDNRHLGKMQVFVTDRDETSEKLLEVVACGAWASVSEIY